MATSERQCAICHKIHDLFTIELETDDKEKYELYVCVTCWDVVAKIAQRAVQGRIKKLEVQVARLLEAVPSAGEVSK